MRFSTLSPVILQNPEWKKAWISQMREWKIPVILHLREWKNAVISDHIRMEESRVFAFLKTAKNGKKTVISHLQESQHSFQNVEGKL